MIRLTTYALASIEGIEVNMSAYIAVLIQYHEDASTNIPRATIRHLKYIKEIKTRKSKGSHVPANIHLDSIDKWKEIGVFDRRLTLFLCS